MIKSRQELLGLANKRGQSQHIHVHLFVRDLITMFDLPCDHDHEYQITTDHGECFECGARLYVSY